MSEEFKSRMARALFGREIDGIHCVACGKEVTTEEFKDELSRIEWGISYLCQECQDRTFKEPEEGEMGLVRHVFETQISGGESPGSGERHRDKTLNVSVEVGRSGIIYLELEQLQHDYPTIYEFGGPAQLLLLATTLLEAAGEIIHEEK